MRNRSSGLARTARILVFALFVSFPAAADTDCLEFVGRWPFGRSGGVAVVGDHAYFGSGFALVTVDVSQTEPQVVGTLDVGGVIWHIEAHGDYLFAGVSFSTSTTPTSSSIRLFNIANPEAPVELPVNGLEGYVSAFTSNGNRLAVSFRDPYHQEPSVLKLFYITSPENPEELGNIENYSGRHIAMEDTRLFLSTGRLVVMDISDPQQIVEVGQFHFPSTPFGFDERLNWVHARGDYVYGTTSHGRLVVFDVSDPVSPTLVGTIVDQAEWGFGEVTTSGDYIITGAPRERLHVVDVSDPTEPVTLGGVAGAGGLDRIVASGNRVFGTNWDSGFHIVAISDPFFPFDIGHIPTPQPGRAIAAIGTQGFTISSDGLRVFDLADPENPTEVGSWPLACYFEGIGTVDDLVYLLSSDHCVEEPSTMSIIDVSESSNPRRIGTVALPQNTGGGHESVGHYVFITDYNGLIAVDVSDPTRPEQVGILATEGYASDVVIHGDYAFVADGREGVAVVDIKDPSRLRLVGEWQGSDRVHSLLVIDGLLLVSTGDNGNDTFFLDISNPEQPTEIDRMELGVSHLQLAGNQAYSFSRGRIEIVDLSQPLSPELLEDYRVFGSVDGGVVLDSMIAVTGHEAGLEIFRGCHLSAGFSHQAEGDSVHFQDTTVGTPATWLWNFGDGFSSTEQNPSHTFEGRCGYPVVSLTVSNDHGHHTTTARVTIGDGHCDDENMALD